MVINPKKTKVIRIGKNPRRIMPVIRVIKEFFTNSSYGYKTLGAQLPTVLLGLRSKIRQDINVSVNKTVYCKPRSHTLY